MVRPPQPPKSFALLYRNALEQGHLADLMQRSLDPAPGGAYLPWDKFRRRPAPEGLSHADWWLTVKVARLPLLRELPLHDVLGRPVRYALVDPIPEHLQRIDRDAAGQILLSEEALSPGDRDRYVVRSLMEEAITSSLLEGAATTRREAKELLRTGRAPTSKGERMVLNNFRAMQQVKTLIGEPLTPDLIRALHKTVTQDAAHAGEPGVFRGADTSSDFGVWSGDRRLYTPPDHTAVPGLIDQVCAFVNDTGGRFVHPVIKAVALHFWIGFVHPFEDGNGRTARALFYWLLLREKYWLFEYVSISTILKDSHAQYARAYLHTETDENDLTYFLLFHLRVIDRALDEVHQYIRRKTQALRETRAVLHPSSGLNHRQIALLRHALQHPDAVYTVHSHRTSHGVVYQTARTDLLGLVESGLLLADTSGRAHRFSVPSDLGERVRETPA